MTPDDIRPDDNPDAEEDMIRTQVDRALSMLREHFDSIQLVATRHTTDDQGTLIFYRGTGNIFARRGAVMDWMNTWATPPAEDQDRY